MNRMRKQAQRFGAEVLDKDVESVDFSSRPFKVVTDEAEYRAKAVIIATGATAKRLHNDAEAKFWNRGISACATCDGALPIFRNKPIAVIGGGDTAMEEALFLTRFGSPGHSSSPANEFRASKVMVERVQKNPKILIKTPYVLEDTHGRENPRADWIKNVKTGAVETLPPAGFSWPSATNPTRAFSGARSTSTTTWAT
jgi:thioredoxin reductase (NADPH)